MIRRDRTGGGGGGGGIRSGRPHNGDGDGKETEDDPRLNDPRWGDPGGRLLDRARAAAVKIATRELAREAKRLALKEKGAIDPVGARKGGEGSGRRRRVVSHRLRFLTSRATTRRTRRAGRGLVIFGAIPRAGAGEGTLASCASARSARRGAREEEEWRSSRSDEEDEDEDEGEGGRDGARSQGRRRTRRTSRRRGAHTGGGG